MNWTVALSVVVLLASQASVQLAHASVRPEPSGLPWVRRHARCTSPWNRESRSQAGGGLRRLLQARSPPLAACSVPPGARFADSVAALSALANASSAVRLDPSRQYVFRGADCLAVSPFRTLTVHCCGATLTPCAACTLLSIQDGARLSLVDCNIDVAQTLTVAQVPPPGGVINASVGVAADNVTEYEFMLHLGVLAGSGALDFVRGSILTSCQVFNSFPYFTSINAAIIGNDTSTSVVTVNDTAKMINLTAPVGYQGGHKEFVNTTILCVPGDSGAKSRLLWLLLLLLLGPLCCGLVACVKRRKSHDNQKASGMLGRHVLGVVCCSTRLDATPSAALENASVSGRSGKLGKLGGGRLSEPLREEETCLGQEHLQLHEVIARGGFGLVQRGTWRNLPVAVKTIVFQVASPSAAALARAKAEASIAYSLTHPNIVATYSHELIAIEASPHSATFKLVLIQELCDCGTLWGLIESGLLRGHEGGPHLLRVHSVLAQISAGMRHVHSKRVTHADLNPANVLLQVSSASGEGAQLSSPVEAALALDFGLCVVKVTDFGLSERLDTAVTHASNMNRGTPFYCAPETCEHSRISPPSDVYSFGVIMWQLAEGVPPFHSVNGIATLHPRFGAFSAVLPRRYVDLARACLEAAPERRPPFEAVLATLGELADEMDGGAFVDSVGRVQQSDVMAWPPGSCRGMRCQANAGPASAGVAVALCSQESVASACERSFAAPPSEASFFPVSSTLSGDLRRFQLAQIGLQMGVEGCHVPPRQPPAGPPPC